jgi:hypothetical protein
MDNLSLISIHRYVVPNIRCVLIFFILEHLVEVVLPQTLKLSFFYSNDARWFVLRSNC